MSVSKSHFQYYNYFLENKSHVQEALTGPFLWDWQVSVIYKHQSQLLSPPLFLRYHLVHVRTCCLTTELFLSVLLTGIIITNDSIVASVAIVLGRILLHLMSEACEVGNTYHCNAIMS